MDLLNVYEIHNGKPYNSLKYDGDIYLEIERGMITIRFRVVGKGEMISLDIEDGKALNTKEDEERILVKYKIGFKKEYLPDFLQGLSNNAKDAFIIIGPQESNSVIIDYSTRLKESFNLMDTVVTLNRLGRKDIVKIIRDIDKENE